MNEENITGSQTLKKKMLNYFKISTFEAENLLAKYCLAASQ